MTIISRFSSYQALIDLRSLFYYTICFLLSNVLKFENIYMVVDCIYVTSRAVCNVEDDVLAVLQLAT